MTGFPFIGENNHGIKHNRNNMFCRNALAQVQGNRERVQSKKQCIQCSKGLQGAIRPQDRSARVVEHKAVEDRWLPNSTNKCYID